MGCLTQAPVFTVSCHPIPPHSHRTWQFNKLDTWTDLRAHSLPFSRSLPARPHIHVWLPTDTFGSQRPSDAIRLSLRSRARRFRPTPAATPIFSRRWIASWLQSRTPALMQWSRRWIPALYCPSWPHLVSRSTLLSSNHPSPCLIHGLSLAALYFLEAFPLLPHLLAPDPPCRCSTTQHHSACAEPAWAFPSPSPTGHQCLTRWLCPASSCHTCILVILMPVVSPMLLSR